MAKDDDQREWVQRSSAQDENENVKEPDKTPNQSPGDQFVLINPETGDVIDLSDIEEMEEFASIANTGDIPVVVDSDVEEMSEYTADPDVLDDFSDRQNFAAGTQRLIENLGNYNELSPEISGGDVDAAWHYADQAGEEGVGGSTPTPDQDVVDELGEALGVQYEDDEPLNTEDKLDARDQNRWELNPDSREEYETLEEETEDDARDGIDGN